MKKLLIVKVGSTFPELRRRRGDFEDWVTAGMGLSPRSVDVTNVEAGDLLPDPTRYAGVVVPGSHAMVTERRPWSERTARWLPTVAAHEIPLLGICYGHQLIAHAFGGVVADNPNGREFGYVELEVRSALDDPLLGALPCRARLAAAHTQSVIRLPRGARPLASTARDPHSAFGLGRRTWGVQTHPEFDAAITRVDIAHVADKLVAEGQDPEALAATCRNTLFGPALLRRFAVICGLA